MTNEKFRNLREQMGLTQAELAGKLGIASNSVSRLELGDRQISPMQAKFMDLLIRMHRFEEAQRRRQKLKRDADAEGAEIKKLVAGLKRSLDAKATGRRRGRCHTVKGRGKKR